MFPSAGSAPEVDPLLCTGLALAGANTRRLAGQQLTEGCEDGLHTATDVYDLDLLGTEMVVLSVCATGLGVYHLGQGRCWGYVMVSVMTADWVAMPVVRHRTTSSRAATFTRVAVRPVP